MLPRWLIGFRALALAGALVAAFVPIATYITDDKRGWLWIHIGVNIAAYIAVALTTIYTTLHLTQQDHNKFSVPAYWANNVIMRTWYLGVSKTWRWHVAAAVGRLGLALALAQHVHIAHIWDFQGIFAPFFYMSYGAESPESLLIRSQWETTLVGFIVLCIFAVLETSVLSAFACLLHTIKIRSRWNPLETALLRVAIIAGFIAIMAGVYHISAQDKQEAIEKYNLQSPFAFNGELKEILKGLQRVAFTWLDDGTMMASDVMRPLGDGQGSFYGARMQPAYHEGLIDYYETTTYNNSRDVFLTLLQALAAMLSYILAIIVTLQLAHYLHWRREQRESPTPAPTTP